SQWYVDKADTFLQHAKDRGIAVIATLWSTPCWASAAPDSAKQSCAGAWWDRGVDRYPPTNASDYADAAAWVATRWASKLSALEIWNEPNLPDKYSLQAADPAAADATLIKAAYPRVKQVAPNLTVLAGALAFSDGDFLQQLYANGIKDNFDGFSIHPYNEWCDPNDTWQPQWKKYTYLTGVPWIQSILAGHGDGDKGLWLTELGWSTCGTGDTWCVTPAQQAQFVGDALRVSAAWTYVKAAVIYNLRNKGTDPQGREDQFGLINRDFSLKPAYASFHDALTGPVQAQGGTGTTTTSTTPTATAPTTTTPTETTPAPLPDKPTKPDVSAPPVSVPAEAAPLPFVVTIPDVAPLPAADTPATGAPKAVAVKIRCQPAAAKRCQGTVRLRSKAGALLASGRFNLRRGLTTARPKLTPAGRSAFGAGRKPTVVATVSTANGVSILRVTVR
ncbi:MAG: hypothetical protein QOJ29_3394, partial [Thermoleophilaceae bacterium]|nr:hypothetical protein [Thermoleophilaceae bacterium]